MILNFLHNLIAVLEDVVEIGTDDEQELVDFNDDKADGDYEPPGDISTSTPMNTFEYPETVSAIRRCRMSAWSGFEVMNSLILDLRKNAPPEIQKFLDQHFLSSGKVENMVKRYGEERAKKHLENCFNQLLALGVDGKKSNVRQKHGRLLQQDKQVIIGND